MAKNPFGLPTYKPADILGGSSSEKKRKPIKKNIREAVWQHYNKNSLTGKCYVCKRPITHDNFDLGHNKAIVKGGSDQVSNLRPICRPCNSGMGTMSIERYKAKYFGGKKPKKVKRKRTVKKKTKQYNPFGAPVKFPTFKL